MKTLFSVSVLVLFCLSLTVFAQEDRPMTLNSPSAVKVPAGKSILLSAPEKETTEKPDQELLRDPFWTIGFFPPNWQRKANAQSQSGSGDAGGWAAAAAGLKISGTSRLGDRTVAIINGEMKSVGEQIEVLHEGKTYHWEVIGIGANGQIQLKKMGN
jgi:hypothetical protein